MRRLRILIRLGAIAAIGLAGAMAAGGLANASPSLAGATLNVKLGGGPTGIAAEGFFPQSITVHAGDTIHFSNQGNEPHTATYLPPAQASPLPPLLVKDPGGSPAMGFNPIYANTTPASPATFDATKVVTSGVLNNGDSYDVTFPSTGSFVFHCAFHPMQLSVKVVAAGASADTQAAVDARATSEFNATVAAAQAQVKNLSSTPATTTALGNGATDFGIVVGGDADVANSTDSADIMQYFPPNISVKVGDSITWTNNQDVPHTVTFLSGATPPGFIAPIPQPSGPPFLALAPAVVFPSGNNVYGGSGITSSGIFGTGFPNPAAYTVKFTAPGTYTYVCLLHGDQGMTGTVTVSGAAAAATATPATGVTAPNTGTGPDAASGGSGWAMLIATVAMAGLVCAFAGAGLARRRTRP